ncbi:MAG: hypothetical protein F9K23_09490 [Bacteroidetes bacterium]|nr:MAG: hypothetical protein F9K23_09490 [Bacteroidota bacterium]
MNIRHKSLFISLSALLLAACAAPRTINQSGKVTPKGNVVAGMSYTANIPTRTIGLMADVLEQNVKDLANKDSITLDENFYRINKAATAFAVDPFGSGYDFYLRAGIANRFELGYKRAGKANAFTGQYQFLGPTGQIGEKQEDRVYGSIALQYSWQNYELPSFFSELQSRLGYKFKRSDILLPVIFSVSFGNEEEYGSLSFGAAMAYSRIVYTTLPDKIFDDNNKPVFGTRNTESFLSFGGFANAKIGYKYVYVVPAMSIFYQNYGTYKLLNDEAFSFKGFTIVPSLSLQLRLSKADLKSK